MTRVLRGDTGPTGRHGSYGADSRELFKPTFQVYFSIFIINFRDLSILRQSVLRDKPASPGAGSRRALRPLRPRLSENGDAWGIRFAPDFSSRSLAQLHPLAASQPLSLSASQPLNFDNFDFIFHLYSSCSDNVVCLIAFNSALFICHSPCLFFHFQCLSIFFSTRDQTYLALRTNERTCIHIFFFFPRFLNSQLLVQCELVPQCV